jgi:methionine-rich copper-binding protein CopC
MLRILNFFKSKNGTIVLWAAGIIAVGMFLWLTKIPTPPQTIADNSENKNQNGLNPAVVAETDETTTAPKQAIKAPAKKAAPKETTFAEKKVPHFVSASLNNNALLNSVPEKITLTFDAPVIRTQESFITVKKDQVTSATINTSYVDGNTMSVRLNPQVTDGDYYVYYVACFADTGCKDGRFGYRVKLP